MEFFILTKEKIKQVLESYPVKSKYNHFSAPVSPPFITWLITGSDNIAADDCVYTKIYEYQIELYTRENTQEEEDKFEDYLTKNGILWDKVSTVWIDEEKVNMSVYSCQ